MPILSACCCFDSLKEGSQASAIFTFINGLIQTVLGIAMLVKLHELDKVLEWNEKYTFLMPGLFIFMYIELAVNFATIGMGFGLWIGINRGYYGKRLIFGWVYSMIAFRSYEFLLGVYLMAWIGKHRFSDILYVAPEIIILIAYWLLCLILLVAAILCVVSYWQEFLNELCGKDNRTRYFSKLVNIRQAALKHQAGTMTPSLRSYYAASQQSLNQHSHATAPSSMSVPTTISIGSSKPSGYQKAPGYRY